MAIYCPNTSIFYLLLNNLLLVKYEMPKCKTEFGISCCCCCRIVSSCRTVGVPAEPAVNKKNANDFGLRLHRADAGREIPSSSTMEIIA